MADRFGYAAGRPNSRYGSTTGTYLDQPALVGPSGIVFKAFTGDSLAGIRARKISKSKHQPPQQQQRLSKTGVDVQLPGTSLDISNTNNNTNIANNNNKLQAGGQMRTLTEPDPCLAAGQQLPRALLRHMPNELYGRPIEDIDPYYADQETFVIISKGKELSRFSASKALYMLGPFHPIRRVVLYLLVSPIFNLIVISTILINCVLMTFQDSEAVERTEIIFTIVYTTELGLKVLARGFILDKFTYLRDPWNWLDFTVIIMAYLTIGVEDLGNLSVIRTFRVLRALKTVAIIPGMKTIVGAVIDSVKNLKDVVVLTLFSLSVFSLLGLQIYMGQLTQKCVLNGPSNMSDLQWHSWCSKASHWIEEIDEDIYGPTYRLCGNATGAQSCPLTHTCLQGFGPNPDYGFTNFDTFGWALICSFRLMTQDFWEGLYMQVLKTAGSWHIIFFIVSIFLGSIYLMNLILAIVAMSYNELQRRAEQEEEAAAEDEAAFLESCRLMELQQLQLLHSGPDNNNHHRRQYQNQHQHNGQRHQRGAGGELGASGSQYGDQADRNSQYSWQSNSSRRTTSRSSNLILGTAGSGAGRGAATAGGSSRRSSYRPSVEIGLVGQSLIASLCRNGLLGQRVFSKLNDQFLVYDTDLVGRLATSNAPVQAGEPLVDLQRASATSGTALDELGDMNPADNQSRNQQRRSSARPYEQYQPQHQSSRSVSNVHRLVGLGEQQQQQQQLQQQQQQQHQHQQQQQPRTYRLGSSNIAQPLISGLGHPLASAAASMTELRRKSSVRTLLESGSPHGQLAAGLRTINCSLAAASAAATIASNPGRRATEWRIGTGSVQSPSGLGASYSGQRIVVSTCTTPTGAHAAGAWPQSQLPSAVVGAVPVSARGPKMGRHPSARPSQPQPPPPPPSPQQQQQQQQPPQPQHHTDQSLEQLAGPRRSVGAQLAPSSSSSSQCHLQCQQPDSVEAHIRRRSDTGEPLTRRDSSAATAPCGRAFASELAICKQPSSFQQGRRPTAAETGTLSPTSNYAYQQAELSGHRRSVASQGSPAADATLATEANRGLVATSSYLGPSQQQVSQRCRRSKLANEPSGAKDSPNNSLSLAPSQMHHLSVENFQRFGSSGQLTARSQLALPGSDQHQQGLQQQQQQLQQQIQSSAGPKASDRMSHRRLSAVVGHRAAVQTMQHHHHHHQQQQQQQQHLLQQQQQLSDVGVRRMSRNFTRRASNWSRLSMSTNVDLRRLLKLWAYTNPYSNSAHGARASVASQNSQSATLGQGRNESPGGFSSVDAQSINSARPSSVGSARQAYELMSALSRRHTRRYSQRYLFGDTSAAGSIYGGQDAFGELNSDDMLNADEQHMQPEMMIYGGHNQDDDQDLDDDQDRMSVNTRDKCLAYCLSCLDVLCIWECCGLWLRVQRLLTLVVFDSFTELFIILCILINTLFMALDSDDTDAHMKSLFERGNYFFTATFAVEAIMKIMALSPKFYFREGWNVFDSIIVGLSLIELGLEGVYGLSVLRSFRLLRVFKLAKSWPTLNLLISIMGKAVGDLGNLTFVLAIIVFIFAVMGMQLFGSKYVDTNFPTGELPRWNFTDFMHSFMIVFRILCAEWIEPMWDCLLVGGWPCVPFFLIAVTVGNLVVLNLFLALLLASFGASNLSAPQADSVDTRKLQEAIARFARLAKWLKRQASRLARTLVDCLTGCCRRGDRRSSRDKLGVGPDGEPIAGKVQKAEPKSHIAAMSKLERMKSIEARTEQLKSKIKRSPEHHYHLRRLARSQVLTTAGRRPSEVPAAPSSAPVRGLNFNYAQAAYNTSGSGHTDGDQECSIAVQPASIPIIVDEAADREDSNDEPRSPVSSSSSLSATNNTSPPGALASEQVADCDWPSGPQSETLEPASSSLAAETASTSLARQERMQPIREDSRSFDSLSEIEIVLSSSSRPNNDYINNNKANFESKPGDPDERPMDQCSAGSSQSNSIGPALPEAPSKSATVADGPEHERLIRPTVENMDTLDGQAYDSDADREPGARSSLYLKPPKKEDMDEDDERALQHIEHCIEHCVWFGIICLKWFLFRQYVRKIVEHRYFDQCILVLIVISSSTLALEDKHLNERPTLRRTLDVLDTVFTLIFSLEMISKWLAFGLRRYFGNIWTWLDFVIVLVSFVNLMASIFGSGKIQALKTMRTLRAMRGLRPLRALQRFQGMRVVVNALIQAIPSIFNVLLVCLIFWLIFSIMGVQMFGGKFWRCLHPETRKVVSFDEAANRHECLERNLTWTNPQINFDNVLNAYLALFQVATFKGWIDIMNSATDSRLRDDQPIREANIYMYFYFVFFVIFGSFFTLNLFIGVIIDNFNEQKKKTGGSLEIFMTDDQKKYYHAMKKMRSKRPVKAMTRPKLKLQALMFDMTTSKKFDMAIMLIIGLNMLVMALEHYGQSQEFSSVLENLNIIFIAIFTLECLCKIFAMRHFYFREPWNVFDFIVVALSLLGVVMKEYVAKYFVSPTLLRVVRVVKVGRVLRLVKGAKVMFIYAIFGMSFFMNVRPRAGIDETFNFETFTSSIIVLFQMSTSAGWDLVLDPLMDEENDCQKPDVALGIEGTCGNKTIAILYLISYVIVTFLIIINMYIAVILENYSQATEDVQEGLTDDDYEMYYEIWQKFDPDGTQYLPYEKLSDFVDALEDPLRIAKPNELALVVLDINIYAGDQCYCVDILDALTKHFFTQKGLDIQVNEHLQQVQSTLHETPFERISTTFLVKRQHYCARIIQNCWRRWQQRTAERCNQRMELTEQT